MVVVLGRQKEALCGSFRRPKRKKRCVVFVDLSSKKKRYWVLVRLCNEKRLVVVLSGKSALGGFRFCRPRKRCEVALLPKRTLFAGRL